MNDAWGNLLQKNVIKGTAENMLLTVNTNNQVATPGFTYDAAGNVIWDTTNALTYDAEGRMNPLSGVTNTYDGDGRRVQKSDGTLYWVDDNFQPLSVGTATGITRDYIFVGGQRIAFVPLSTGNPYYYLSDHLGSDTVVASGDGKSIQWEGEFFPFGLQRTVITNLADNPYQFTGYEYDSGTGYNYAVARYDAGRWGRFLSPDPYMGSIDATNPQSLNRYAYVQNNPLRLVDPLGLDETDANSSPCDDWDTTCFVTTEDSESSAANTWSCGLDCLGINVDAASPDPATDWSDLPLSGLGFLGSGSTGGSAPDSCMQLPQNAAQQQYCKALQQGLDAAKKALRKKACSAFYGGMGSQTLDATQYRFLELARPSYGAQTNSPTSVFVNTQEAYVTYSPTSGQQGPFGRYWTQSSFRGFILLHELGHQLSSTTGFQPDTGSRLNQAQSNIVLANCF